MIDKVIKSDMSIFASNISTLFAGSFFMLFLSSDDFFQNYFFIKIFQEHYQSVKRFGPRSGLTFFRS